MRALRRFTASNFGKSVVAALVVLYIRVVFRTNRWQRVNYDIAYGLEKDERRGAVCFWHSRLLMLPYMAEGSRPFYLLTSDHRDGQLISKCAWHYNIKTVTGSSSRGGIGAARKLIRLAREGHCLFITPDGPRGPRMHVNESILDLSLLTGLPILAAAISTGGGRELGTWDRFLVPRPFSCIAIRWGKPFRVDQKEDASAVRARLEAELNALQLSADRAVGRVGRGDPDAFERYQ